MSTVSAVLFDRDGTLVADVPYNGEPGRVRLLPGAAQAVALARSHGLGTGVVSNPSGIGRGLLTTARVRRVNERADALLGGLDVWEFCPHAPDADCACRKPRPGLILAAAARLGVAPAACVVIGDIAADVLAAHAAGARGLLVPNAVTAPDEVERFADLSAPSLPAAVRRVLDLWCLPAPEDDRRSFDTGSPAADGGRRGGDGEGAAAGDGRAVAESGRRARAGAGPVPDGVCSASDDGRLRTDLGRRDSASGRGASDGGGSDGGRLDGGGLDGGGSVPGHGTPAHGTPGQGTPTHGTPGQGTPGQGTPGQGTPGQGTPGHGAPGHGRAAVDRGGPRRPADPLTPAGRRSA